MEREIEAVTARRKWFTRCEVHGSLLDSETEAAIYDGLTAFIPTFVEGRNPTILAFHQESEPDETGLVSLYIIGEADDL